MINIRKNENNEFILYLNEDVSINDPFYIFRFVDTYNRETIHTLVDDTSANSFNTFLFYEGLDVTLHENGMYYVYESPVDTSILTGLTELEHGKYKLTIDPPNLTAWDPSISYVDIVWDPDRLGVIDGGSTWGYILINTLDGGPTYVYTLINKVDGGSW